MRNEYLNDIGDYIKYALLRQLAGARPGDERSRRNLGVLWFLTVHPEANNDGRHRSYLTHDGYAALDPSLILGDATP